jgi:hypothetical protein
MISAVDLFRYPRKLPTQRCGARRAGGKLGGKRRPACPKFWSHLRPNTGKNGSWIDQKKARTAEETACTHIGTTENGLLVVVAAFSGGGSGDFTFLHILDVTAAHGFNFDGKIYERINLSSRGQWVTEKQWRATPA